MRVYFCLPGWLAGCGAAKKAVNEEHEKEKAAAELRKKRAEGIAPWGLADVKPPKVLTLQEPVRGQQ